MEGHRTDHAAQETGQATGTPERSASPAIDAAEEMAPVVGRVKWFDATRGFGFLISDELVQAAQAETGTTNSLLGEFSRTEPQRLRNRAEPVALWAWPRRAGPMEP